MVTPIYKTVYDFVSNHVKNVKLLFVSCLYSNELQMLNKNNLEAVKKRCSQVK